MRCSLQNADEGVPMVLVATKTDVTDRIVVDQVEAQALAAQHGVPLFWTSSKTNTNVTEAFEQLARLAMTRVLEAAPRGGGTVKPSKDEKGGASGGCSC
jgi:GTPase SAR1 family protein